MITLYTFPKAFGLRNVSPFCLKAEMALTHLNTPFRLTEVSDPRKSPKGKLPFVDFNGRLVSDSEIIFDHLDMLTQGNLYKGLSSREMAQGEDTVVDGVGSYRFAMWWKRGLFGSIR